MAPREGRLTLDGRRVRYREAGCGPPCVVVHGLGLSSGFWVPHFPSFAAAGLRLVAPDLPGFGGSAGGRLGLGVGETAEWLLAFAAALDLAMPAWIGHSLAAQATMELAVRAPHRARALVLASPTGAPGRWRLARQVVGFLRDIGREPPALIPIVAREYLKGSLPAFLGTWLRAAGDHPLEKARRIGCPTLVVVGRDDPVVPPTFIELLLQRIPKSRLAVLPGGAHGVVSDRSGEFDSVATAFLRECLRG
jgi:pimeloyl-ACP methyl ester carboxylesterase